MPGKLYNIYEFQDSQFVSRLDVIFYEDYRVVISLQINLKRFDNTI